VPSSLELYNSLGRTTQTFEPLEEGRVRLYVCGVTVYDDCHIGHGRAYVVFDVLRRFLEWEGYEVRHVQNFTDVEDKIIGRAREENREPEEVAVEYTRAYFDVMDRLNVRRADVYPTVRGHIAEIIEHVEGLLRKDMAYEAEGSVYFRVEKFEDYGKLSGQDPDEMLSGARVEVEEHKQSPLDFALWKASKEGEPAWDSPWGPGRPGWHIECSVMSRTHLGDTLDIHGGGRDLIFPHHENEIAQTEGLTGKPFARFWVHNGFVTVDEEKMSKSEDNFYTLEELYDEFDPAVIRFFILTRHYRSPLDFSFERLHEAREALERLRGFHRRLREAEAWPCGRVAGDADAQAPDREAVREDFLDALRSDLNTARALGHLQEWVRAWNRTLEDWQKQPRLARGQQEAISRARAWLEEALEEILGVPSGGGDTSGGGDVDDLVEMCLRIREQAREQGHYGIADALRDGLEERGFEVEDTPRGPRWTRRRE